MTITKRLIKSMLRVFGYEIRHASDVKRDKSKVYDFQEEAEEKIAIIRPYTMVSWEPLVTLYQQVRWIEKNDIPGDFVECGVWKGGAVGLMALGNLAFTNARRHIHCFDAFDDICEPDPTHDDDQAIQQVAQLSGRDPRSFSGALRPVKGVYGSKGGPGSLEEVKKLLEEKINYPGEYLHYWKGWFQDTLPTVSETVGKISILRLDCDLYASTRVSLEWLYDKVIPGGFVIIDDYGAYNGCRKAVDEFLNSRRERVYLHHVNKDCRYWIK